MGIEPECVICCNAISTVVFSCNHCCYCALCFDKLIAINYQENDYTCPICRVNIIPTVINNIQILMDKKSKSLLNRLKCKLQWKTPRPICSLRIIPLSKWTYEELSIAINWINQQYLDKYINNFMYRLLVAQTRDYRGEFDIITTMQIIEDLLD